MQWSQVIGHEKSKEFLQQLLAGQQNPHAFLFSGLKGIGKRLLADIFAQAFLCSDLSKPCNECPSCRAFALKNHPDYLVIEPELKPDGETRKNSLSIMQLRELLQETAFSGKLSKNRVIIVDEAHLLTMEAANSLLKVLEEPPKGWLFVLITDKQELILPTILSRVTMIKLEALTAEQTIGYLQHALEVNIPKEIIAKLANGSIGQALYLAEQEAEQIRQQTLSFLISSLAGSYLKAYQFVRKIPKDKASLACEYLVYFLRDLSCLKVEEKQKVWNLDLVAELEKISESLSLASLQKLLRYTEVTLDSIKRSANPQITLEGLYILMSNEVLSVAQREDTSADSRRHKI